MRKELIESSHEITVVGFVREIRGSRNSNRVGIAVSNEIYAVVPNGEGQNLLYEIGNKVEVTGTISMTKDDRRRIEVTGYEVYEMTEDDPEEFDFSLEYKFKPE